MLDGVFAKFSPNPAPANPPENKPADPKPEGFNVAEMKPLFEQLGQTFATEIGSLRTEMRGEVDRLSIKVKQIEDGQEKAPANHHTARPTAAGSSGQYVRTDC
jgi:hypothetical protein